MGKEVCGVLHCCQGIPQFVREHRQESVALSHGFVRNLLHAFLRRDIRPETGNPNHLSRIILQRIFGRQISSLASADLERQFRLDTLSGLENLPILLLDLQGSVRRQKLPDGLALHLLGRDAEDSFGLAIEHDEAPLQILAHVLVRFLTTERKLHAIAVQIRNREGDFAGNHTAFTLS